MSLGKSISILSISILYIKSRPLSEHVSCPHPFVSRLNGFLFCAIARVKTSYLNFPSFPLTRVVPLFFFIPPFPSPAGCFAGFRKAFRQSFSQALQSFFVKLLPEALHCKAFFNFIFQIFYLFKIISKLFFLFF